MLVEDGFAESNFIHAQLKKLGIESKVIFYNNRNLQDKWGSEYKSTSYFDILLMQIKEFAPDIILISDMSRFTKEETKIIKTYVHTINKLVGFHFTTLDDRFKQNVSLYDQVYTGSKSFVNMMRNCGIPAYLLRHAFEPKILDKLPDTERKNEVCFSGSIVIGEYAHNNRLDMLDILGESNVPYAFYGDIYNQTQADERYLNIINKVEKSRKASLFGLDYYSALNQYNVCVNMHAPSIWDSVGSAGNVRMFEVTGLGSCLLTDYRNENAEIFDVDSEIVVYQSMEDMVEKAKWLLENPEKAKETAIAGQKKTLANYTYKNKAEQLNEYIQELLK